jgi:hypothetical protein
VIILQVESILNTSLRRIDMTEKQTFIKLSCEKQVLTEILAEEVTKRKELQVLYEETREDASKYRSMLRAISHELLKSARKEELVKSLKIILGDIQF